MGVKMEGQNPTGSHKDRMSPLVVARAIDKGGSVVTTAASSGNAGASLAAYTARAGLCCVIVTTSDLSHAAPIAWVRSPRERLQELSAFRKRSFRFQHRLGGFGGPELQFVQQGWYVRSQVQIFSTGRDKLNWQVGLRISPRPVPGRLFLKMVKTEFELPDPAPRLWHPRVPVPWADWIKKALVRGG
ncbi:pyridoxal-phosphate dependent enzyme [Melghirimyces profundicolus]|uniref:Pyridoxal-phosphate dependent enzyme n=2 Tax=Melghirimyces profundicolus TaxID=1242148 RepID=A0A2T6BVA1_9BACL|nr:pyridoxal-phosphate dependent enzyme [Melghirimyces profundicolus]